MSANTKILFVCLGNICRSPMAEAMFKHKVRLANRAHDFEIDSAGTGPWHIGKPAHRGTLNVLQRNGIPIEHTARQISTTDLSYYDLIVTMDDQNRKDVLSLGSGTAPVLSMMSYATNSSLTDVPDPYHDGRFDEVFSLLDDATEGLLISMLEQHRL